jgi:hypothetical protein
VSWLLRRGGADAPVKLKEAKKTLFGVGNTGIYANMTKLQCWNQTLQLAAQEGLIELNNMHFTRRELTARGEHKTIRLLERGPFLYV